MNGAPTHSDAWAKLKREHGQHGDVIAWHSVIDHSADVAACAQAMLEHSVLRHRLGRLTGQGELTDVHVARLCVLIALHDAGKCSHDFQDKAWGKKGGSHLTPVLDALCPEHDVMPGYRDTMDAVYETLGMLTYQGWCAPDDMTLQVGATDLLMFSVVSHHGKPVKPSKSIKSHTSWTQRETRDPLKGLSELVERAHGWFPEAFTPANAMHLTPTFHHAFNGLVTLADWMGSNEAFFPFGEDPHEDRMAWARARARHMLGVMDFDARVQKEDLGRRDHVGFETISTFDPRPIQAITQAVELEKEGSLWILEAETGSGKTEAALAHFMRLLAQDLVDGLYFALPTRTAATQLHSRVLDAVRQAFPDPDHQPPVTLAVPGYIQTDDRSGLRQAAFEVLWDEDDHNRPDRRTYRGWASETPKRFLAGSVVVGTIDQVLMSTLMVKHSHMRATALLRHLLVVDEVHASDVYMGELLEQALAFHLSAGGHALLMSATLGSSMRARFYDHPIPAFDQAIDVPYPALHTAHDTHALDSAQQASILDKRVRVHLHALMNEHDATAAKIAQHAQTGRVLVIRNTVTDCVATQQALEAHQDTTDLFCVNKTLTVHHARFAKEDRVRLDRAVEQVLGKRAQCERVALVATQTVEQSLDIDADVLWTDLCPMDVLLQRIGRLHRHTTRDPHRHPTHATPTVHVLVPKESLEALVGKGKHGLGSVYPNLMILEATLRQLKSLEATSAPMAIPSMNRRLVEEATHPERLATIRASSDAWARHEQLIEGTAVADMSTASMSIVHRTETFATTETFPDDRLLRTRLGDPGFDVALEHAVEGPFGDPVQRFCIPSHMLPQDDTGQVVDIPEDAQVEDVRVTPGAVRFSFLNTPYLYTRLGLQREFAP